VLLYGKWRRLLAPDADASHGHRSTAKAARRAVIIALAARRRRPRRRVIFTATIGHASQNVGQKRSDDSVGSFCTAVLLTRFRTTIDVHDRRRKAEGKKAKKKKSREKKGWGDWGASSVELEIAFALAIPSRSKCEGPLPKFDNVLAEICAYCFVLPLTSMADVDGWSRFGARLEVNEPEAGFGKSLQPWAQFLCFLSSCASSIPLLSPGWEAREGARFGAGAWGAAAKGGSTLGCT
jgi:hypothetical protein